MAYFRLVFSVCRHFFLGPFNGGWIMDNSIYGKVLSAQGPKNIAMGEIFIFFILVFRNCNHDFVKL